MLLVAKKRVKRGRYVLMEAHAMPIDNSAADIMAMPSEVTVVLLARVVEA